MAGKISEATQVATPALDDQFAINQGGAARKTLRGEMIIAARGAMYDEGNTDAFVVNVAADEHAYHTNGLVGAGLAQWTFDAGGNGTSFPIASIADGADSGVDIEVTTTGSHGLAVGGIVSQTDLASAVYTGMFVVKAIISATQYEVAAVFTATDTGTMDQAATLTAGALAAGNYSLMWDASGDSASSNQIVDLSICLNATPLVGSSVRRKFGVGADIGSMSGIAPGFAVVAGDKISFVVANTTSAANLTFRNLTLTLHRLDV